MSQQTDRSPTDKTPTVTLEGGSTREQALGVLRRLVGAAEIYAMWISRPLRLGGD